MLSVALQPKKKLSGKDWHSQRSGSMTGSRRFASVEPAALKEREDGQGRVINMLIFYCNHSNEMFTGGDYESTDQIVERLDEHIKNAPRQRLPSREQRALPRRDLTLYD